MIYMVDGGSDENSFPGKLVKRENGKYIFKTINETEFVCDERLVTETSMSTDGKGDGNANYFRINRIFTITIGDL